MMKTQTSLSHYIRIHCSSLFVVNIFKKIYRIAYLIDMLVPKIPSMLFKFMFLMLLLPLNLQVIARLLLYQYTCTALIQYIIIMIMKYYRGLQHRCRITLQIFCFLQGKYYDASSRTEQAIFGGRLISVLVIHLCSCSSDD